MRDNRLLFIGIMLLSFFCNLTASGAAGLLDDAGSWVYQLQNVDPDEISASSSSLVVMDYSRDGTDAGAYAASEIKAIKDSGKIVLAYLSIGEAENYRFYWQDWWRPGNPIWLGPENPEWPGNYKVLYGHPGWWRSALQPYLNRIIAAGFDGVYLDIIDAYWYWHDDLHLPLAFTANQMVSLVTKIGSYSRASLPAFILCPQNGESIIDDADAAARSRYLSTIDAVGVEDLFYHYGTRGDQFYRLKTLWEYARTGNKIFNIEYISTGQWQEYSRFVCMPPFTVVPYAGAPDRALDELVDFPAVVCGGNDSRADGAYKIDISSRGSLQNPAWSPDGKSLYHLPAAIQ